MPTTIVCIIVALYAGFGIPYLVGYAEKLEKRIAKLEKEKRNEG